MSRLGGVATAYWVCAVLFAAAPACRADQTIALAPSTVRDGMLAAGQHDHYRIVLPPGAAIEFSAYQLDTAVQLDALPVAGAPWPRVRNDAGRQARLRLSLIADRRTTWNIDIAAVNGKHPAHYRIGVGRVHKLDNKVRWLATAQQALARAEAMRRQSGSLELGKKVTAAAPSMVLSSYQAAIDAARAAGDDCVRLMANSDRARYEFATGHYVQARDSEYAALKFRCGRDGDVAAAAEEAAAQRTLGAALGYLGDFTAAIAAQERALALYRKTGDLNFQTMTLGNLSADYRVTGATHKALAAAKAALALAQKIGSRRRAIFARESIAAILMQRGEWGKARQTYLGVLDALHATPYPLIEGMTWGDLGQVDWELRDTTQSQQAFAHAEALAAKSGNHEALADTRLDEADVALESDHADTARAIFRANLDDDVAQGLQREQVHALIGLGRCAVASKAWDEARKNLNAARDLAHKIGAAALQTWAHQALGDLETIQHLPKQADADYRRGYAIALRANDVNSRIVLLGSRARLALDSGDPQAAEKLIALAISLIEGEQAQVDAPSLRTHYFASLRAYYDLSIDCLMRLNHANPGKGYALQALQVSEQARARALRDRLLARSVDVAPRADPKLITAEHAAQDDLRQAAWRRAQLPVGVTAKAQQQAQSAIDDAGHRLDEVRGQLRAADPRYAQLAHPTPLDLPALQRSALDDDVVVLEYWLGDAHSYRWRITRDAVQASVLPPRAVLEKSAAALRASLLVPGTLATDTSFAARAKAIADAAARLRQQALALGKILLLADKADGKTRVVIADGELQRIPFDLLDAATDHAHVYLPSLATLSELRANPLAQRTPSIAVFADPVFSADDPRLTGHTATDRTSQLTESPLRETSTDMGIDALSRLPYSHKEATDIAALVAPSARWVVTGFAANRASALGADWSRYTLVHFATHALMDMRHPQLSGVVLSLYDAQGHRQDGVLRMQDIYNLRMPVELVTLSVCDSTGEPDLGAEGSFGLSRAFFYAGVRRLLVSLWAVDDRASAQLMALFYRQLLVQHAAPQVALQSAQAALRRDPRWRAPYYWAGFVVQGDWR